MFGDFVYRARFACVMFALILLCLALADVFTEANLIGWMFQSVGKWLTAVFLSALYVAAPYFRHWFRK